MVGTGFSAGPQLYAKQQISSVCIRRHIDKFK